MFVFSELVTATDNYIPMHGITTGGQEDIAVITFSSNDMEGETPHQDMEWINKNVSLFKWICN